MSRPSPQLSLVAAIIFTLNCREEARDTSPATTIPPTSSVGGAKDTQDIWDQGQAQPIIEGGNGSFLTAPFLQNPDDEGVFVVWLTDFPGQNHRVTIEIDGQAQTFPADTSQCKCFREDQDSHREKTYSLQWRRVYRHEAKISGLEQDVRYPYFVTTDQETSEPLVSKSFNLSANPSKAAELKILLTSDHQQKPMVAANIQLMAETVGQVDGVFFAGDLVNVPERGSEWFDDTQGHAFFKVLQGQASYEIEGFPGRIYSGASVIQSAPLFPAIGNHEVMGQTIKSGRLLADGFEKPRPKAVTEELFQSELSEIEEDQKQLWIQKRSWNTDTYEHLFTLPTGSGSERYYGITFGGVRLISLFVTRIWRSKAETFSEASQNLNDAKKWGYGRFVFEPIKKDSPQYLWLAGELASKATIDAELKIVMLHHPMHSLGDNVSPPFTDPAQETITDEGGNVSQINYTYAIADDYLIKDLLPLLEQAAVDLVLYGHSHIYNRFYDANSGIHFLETSNVGNTYGAFNGEDSGLRNFPVTSANYVTQGDPNGLTPIEPNLSPLKNSGGENLPYLASNRVTVFSILNTKTKTISSYRFDVGRPDEAPVKFDEFIVGRDGKGL